MANKILKVTGSILISCLMVMSLSSTIKAEEQQPPINCKITTGSDFDNLYITVKGIGKPPANAATPTIGKSLAKRAAMADAQRNLAKLVGVTVKEVQDNTVIERVSAVIQGAKIISEKELPDGSYEVEMTMPVLGVTRQTNTQIDTLNAELEKSNKNIEELNNKIKELNDKLEKQKKALEIIKQTTEQTLK